MLSQRVDTESSTLTKILGATRALSYLFDLL